MWKTIGKKVFVYNLNRVAVLFLHCSNVFLILRKKKDGDCTFYLIQPVKYKESFIFCSICSCAIKIVYTGFQGFRTFLYVFF